MTHYRPFGRLALGVASGLAAGVFALAPAWGQLPLDPDKELPKPPIEAAKDAAKDAKDTAKDAAKDARDATKDATRDATKDARDAAKDAPRDVRDAARDAGAAPREATRDARDAARDVGGAVRGAARDAGAVPREAARDARDAARDVGGAAGAAARTAGGAAGAARGAAQGAADAAFNWQTVRAADLGLGFNAATDGGLTIANVAQTGPIARIGLRTGDRILSVNGQRIVREADFTRYLFTGGAATAQVPVVVWRGGRQQTIYMQPDVFIQELRPAAGAPAVGGDPLAQFGIALDDRNPDRIVVAKVFPQSPAFFAGIKVGDLIVALNDQRLGGPDDLVALLEKGGQSAMRVEVSRQLDVDLARRAPQGTPHTALKPTYGGTAPMPQQGGYATPGATVTPAAPTTVAPATQPTVREYNNSNSNYGRGVFGGRRR